MLKRHLTTSPMPFKIRARAPGHEAREYEQPAGRDVELAELTARRRYQEEVGLSRLLRDKIITEIVNPPKV